MNRALSSALAAAGLVLATLALAPSADAVTNPADNPHKITVKGDDGNTYVDGQDTLPGYDDDECTYIPGAYFDFDNNRVRYADGQSIPWTEWDRATGYKEWLANKNKPASGGSSTPKPTSGTTKKSTTTTKSSGTTKTTTKSSTSSPAGSTSPTDAATPTAGPSASAGSTPTGAATPSAAVTPSEAATDDVDEVTLASGAATQTDAPGSAESGGTGSAGLLILGGLAGVGLLTFAGYSVLGRKRKATTP